MNYEIENLGNFQNFSEISEWVSKGWKNLSPCSRIPIFLQKLRPPRFAQVKHPFRKSCTPSSVITSNLQHLTQNLVSNIISHHSRNVTTTVKWPQMQKRHYIALTWSLNAIMALSQLSGPQMKKLHYYTIVAPNAKWN